MVTKNSIIYIALFFLMILAHFEIWHYSIKNFQDIFFKYYLFQILLFVMVVVVLSSVSPIYPDFVGFVFLGLIFIKLSLSMIMIRKFHINEYPHFRLHFIIPYLISLTLEILYAIDLIKKNRKNH